MKLLLVDDNDKIRQIMKDFYSPYFDEVVECSDGREAVDQFPVVHPDWTVMDVKMKSMDGIEAARQILSEQGKAKIILVSQFGDEGTIFAAKESGAIAFVKKDNLENVIEVIKQSTIK
ncbi:MAG: response regulator transcription factor [Bacteroidota bacterium]|jgi:NarL family two-component system response regulator LiaR